MNLAHNKVGVSIPYSMLRISLNPLTLVFTGHDSALEKPFRHAYFSNSLDHVRRCKLYAILFFSIKCLPAIVAAHQCLIHPAIRWP
jgi:two-component system cell cycle sensor histidine kinase/response regulator CckA